MCQDPEAPGTSLEVSMSRLSPKNKSHSVKFEVTGVEHIQSKAFETNPIGVGKAARCVINDSFEVL
jgi:hypothetical protein